MAALLQTIGGLTIALSLAFMGVAGAGGGMGGFLGAVAVGGPAFVGGLMLAGFGKMIESLDRIVKATERQAEAIDAMRSRRHENG